jgi:trans-feruloyl-CoA hydratase/vanillin synthase
MAIDGGAQTALCHDGAAPLSIAGTAMPGVGARAERQGREIPPPIATLTREGSNRMPSNYTCITCTVDDRVATVTFNRPDKRNAMSPQLNDEMADVLEKIAADGAIDVVVLTGAGESFTAGMDLKEYFRETQHDPLLFEQARNKAWEWQFRKLRFMPQVTIAAVNGWCFGGAFTPLVSCDIAIAAEEATFGLSEVNWGIIPAGLVTKDVALAMGYRNALYYIITGESFGGARALELGLVNECVPRSELMTRVGEITKRLRGLNPHVLRSAKEAYRHSLNMDYDQAWDYLAAKSAQLRTRDTEEGRKIGMGQFLDDKSFKPGLGAYLRPGSGDARLGGPSRRSFGG